MDATEPLVGGYIRVSVSLMSADWVTMRRRNPAGVPVLVMLEVLIQPWSHWCWIAALGILQDATLEQELEQPHGIPVRERGAVLGDLERVLLQVGGEGIEQTLLPLFQ